VVEFSAASESSLTTVALPLPLQHHQPATHHPQPLHTTIIIIIRVLNLVAEL